MASKKGPPEKWRTGRDYGDYDEPRSRKNYDEEWTASQRDADIPPTPIDGADVLMRSQGRNSLYALETFFERSLLTGIDGLLKIGKEASAYRCTASSDLGGGLVVAKVYRGRQYRFKNSAPYMEGRDRMLRGQVRRAVQAKSVFGQQVGSVLWVDSEWQTMNTLYEAGADVPKPLALSSGALLMEYFGDEEDAAPQLNRVRLRPHEAKRAFDGVMRNVELMLSLNLVHGDLSAHNILWWKGRAVVIDFPQAVDPRFNSNARDFLYRDVANVCEYFTRQGIQADPVDLAEDLWRRFRRSVL